MIILGIETSCDETSAAIVEGNDDSIILKSNVVASSLSLHAKTGGIIPETAARMQLKYMIPVLQEALEKAHLELGGIDAVAVTYGPGLIGSLLVGVETAKTLAFVLQKPIIPVNHMIGHIYANFIGVSSKLKVKNSKLTNEIKFPLITLVVSGGHTDLLLIKSHGEYKLLGGTRDDAAGEAFDKIGRLIGLPYPAGPEIEKTAKLGDPKRFHFPRPLIGSDDYDFSFSGLKTAVFREVNRLHNPNLAYARDSSASPQNDMNEQTIHDIAASVQRAIIDVLIKKTLRTVKQYGAKSVLLSGGVAANQSLREAFQSEIEKQKINAKLFFPAKNLCTDNAAMIASAAYFNHNTIEWSLLTANPELYYE